jgi:uncharacterized membrane protein
MYVRATAPECGHLSVFSTYEEPILLGEMKMAKGVYEARRGWMRRILKRPMALHDSNVCMGP